MSGLIRILLISIIIWYVIKWILKLIFPYSRTKDFDRNHHKADREGDVIIHFDEKKTPHSDGKAKEGDYVDYEEVE